ncbi:NAD(P)-dependent oxidoreductase [Vibrio campbellii]|uniref:NAD(P)-dependent oxidoreductase n=1 Tax=Vibrio campbellii TaxID=680 RepID=UPI001E57A5F4|nr:NAD(P)-dependent oxidoreductase [Vibrio campbellii]MCC8253558.1 NAD(P)-binding domain-containing protein [Vibrio campbellii CAIM 333]
MVIVRINRIAFIGFGEAATAFISSWHNKSPEIINAFDLKTNSPKTREQKLLEYIEHGVQGTFHPQDAIDGTQIVFSLVTADQAEAALKDLLPKLDSKQVIIDGNSCSPQTKKSIAEQVEQRGASYVDMAIMAPVLSSAPAIPVYLSGEKAAEVAEYLNSLGFVAEVISKRAGDASSIKMLRSVMVKGLEALTTECVLAARKSGVEKYVLNSLSKTYPGLQIDELSRYHMERMLCHGERRHAELQEVAATLDDLNIDHPMVKGAMSWHQSLGSMPIEDKQQPLEPLSDEIIKHLQSSPRLVAAS